jgi:Ca-activated chloride channel homolog
MTMRIGNKIVTARVKEREEAHRQFEKAKAEGKSASLLEQERPNVFSMSVSNIMPGDRIAIELNYTEHLVPSEGTYEFVYPTVVGPRYSNTPEDSAPQQDKWIKSPYLEKGAPPTSDLSIAAVVSTGVPLQELICPTHKTIISWEKESIARVADGAASARKILPLRRPVGRACPVFASRACGCDHFRNGGPPVPPARDALKRGHCP